MILVLDVGNSQIHGGLYRGQTLVSDFRQSTTAQASEDEVGLFLLQVLREWNCTPEMLQAVGVASVVPSLTHSLELGIHKYLKADPFILQPGRKTGLQIRTKSPGEVGADRIACCIGGLDTVPDENLIIVDLGTATTFECVSADRAFLGGVIAPGLRVSMEALSRRTAQLPAVNIEPPAQAMGKDTITNIQSGLYFGHVGMIRELVPRLRREAFGDSGECRVLGTGGYARLLDRENLFDAVDPHLVLRGIRLATELNLNLSSEPNAS